MSHKDSRMLRQNPKESPMSRHRNESQKNQKRPARQTQRGVALVELLLITVPLCCLSIVLASALAATSTAKNKAMWKASLQTQQATREPCAGAPLLYLPTMSSKQSQFNQGRSKAGIIALEGIDITLTNYKSQQVTEPVGKFYFEQATNQMFPDRTQSAQNTATFLCNEPNNGDSRRTPHEVIVYGTAFLKSQELY